MKAKNKMWYQLPIVVIFLAVLIFSSAFLVQKTGSHMLGAVTYSSGVNATLTIFDDGDSIKTAARIVPDMEVNNLFNDTSNVYFYANYTNSTGQSLLGTVGTFCTIEFEFGAAGNPGPFTMIENNTRNVWEYNRSFANNGTFIWNVTCQNPTLGTETLRSYDSVRIFGLGCTDPTATFPNEIRNNTILCGGTKLFNPAATGSSIFTINQNNVTFDCNFTIFRGANSGTGINIGSYNGTIIKNCIFENYSNTINSSSSTQYNIILYNNSFANLTANAFILNNVSNLTVSNNNFTNISGYVMSVQNTSGAVKYNYFCNNGQPTIYGTNSLIGVSNNTLCINLISPANNTDTSDINFTFFSPVLDTQICQLITNGNKSGTKIISQEVQTNITLNWTLYDGNIINWQVNCTSNNDNNGISSVYNITYGACTIPSDNMTIRELNVTLCPGTYRINTSSQIAYMNNNSAGIICNNTVIQGNGTGAFIMFKAGVWGAHVENCVISNYGYGVNSIVSPVVDILIYNNTFQTFSEYAIYLRNNVIGNVSNNTFTDHNQSIYLKSTENITIQRNEFTQNSNGIIIDTSANATFFNNTFNNLSSEAIVLLTPTNLSITYNLFCSDMKSIFGSIINVTMQNNTICVYSKIPANNTNWYDSNFTFFSGALDEQVCTVIVNGNNSGSRTVPANNGYNATLTVNTSLYDGTQINWQINCTNNNQNRGLSAMFNTTAETCTIPTAGMSIPAMNITLCSGTYYLNTTSSIITINSSAAGIICNNTIIRGNGSNILFALGEQASDARIQNCVASDYEYGIYYTGRNINNSIILNNSFTNIRQYGVYMYDNGFSNITANLFTNNSIAIFLNNSVNTNLLHNLMIGSAQAIKLGSTTYTYVRNNTITNTTTSAISMSYDTNASVISNTFTTLFSPISGPATGTIAQNNTITPYTIYPTNLIDLYDINFTFYSPSIDAQTCTLITKGNQSGYKVIPENNTVYYNITLNTSYYNTSTVAWRVNCTSANNNNGITDLTNTTYRSCTVPSNGMTIFDVNVSLCPGTYYLNSTPEIMYMSGNAAEVTCNNTIIIGNNSGALMSFRSTVTDVHLQNCIISNYDYAVYAYGFGINRTIIKNNSFSNFSKQVIYIESSGYSNITNNLFSNGQDSTVYLHNTMNVTIVNNSFIHNSGGIEMKNSSYSVILNNNMTNLTNRGILMDVNTPWENKTEMNATIANNYFCGINRIALSFVGYNVSSTLNGILDTNTFCNTSDATPNGGIADVSWTTDFLVLNNEGYITGSWLMINDLTGAFQSSVVNATGGSSILIKEFNITANKQVLVLTPYLIVANQSTLTKTINAGIRESRTNALGNALVLNLSNPDTVPFYDRRAAERARRASSGGTAPVKATTESEGDNKEEEKEESGGGTVIIKPITYTYSLAVNQINFNDNTIFENGVIYESLTMKDYETYELQFIVENTGTGNLTDLVYSLELPQSVTIVSSTMDKNIIPAGESATVFFTVHSEDISNAFDLVFRIYSPTHTNADISATLKVILEEGKGSLYSTREKIIEETRAVITKTYEILFILFLIPLLLLLRATTIVDENALRRMIEDKKITEYWRVYVPEEAYVKYDSFQNLRPIKLEEGDIANANHLAAEFKMSYQVATAIVFAQQCLIPKVFTLDEITPEVRHKYPRVLFTSPLRNYKEDQLKRYIEKQQEKGFTNNEIRQTLLQAKWDKDVIKKYVHPEDELKPFIAEQKKKGFSLGEIRKELLEVKWDKTLVDAVIPREEVLKEYIAEQRKAGKTNAQIKAGLVKVGWEKTLLDKYLNAESDLKAYIIFQQHRGFTNDQISAELLKRGWKKEIVGKYLKEK